MRLHTRGVDEANGRVRMESTKDSSMPDRYPMNHYPSSVLSKDVSFQLYDENLRENSLTTFTAPSKTTLLPKTSLHIPFACVERRWLVELTMLACFSSSSVKFLIWFEACMTSKSAEEEAT